MRSDAGRGDGQEDRGRRGRQVADAQYHQRVRGDLSRRRQVLDRRPQTLANDAGQPTQEGDGGDPRTGNAQAQQDQGGFGVEGAEGRFVQQWAGGGAGEDVADGERIPRALGGTGDAAAAAKILAQRHRVVVPFSGTDGEIVCGVPAWDGRGIGKSAVDEGGVVLKNGRNGEYSLI